MNYKTDFVLELLSMFIKGIMGCVQLPVYKNIFADDYRTSLPNHNQQMGYKTDVAKFMHKFSKWFTKQALPQGLHNTLSTHLDINYLITDERL